MSLRDLRKDYQRGSLDEHDVGDDPFALFSAWLDAAVAAELPEPNAMTLSTVGSRGQPSSRIVLLRHYDQAGLQFFTNYLSRKGREMENSANVSLLFFWPQLERQIRIEGRALRCSPETSDLYFASRPYESQLGAHASRQSEIIAGSQVLTERLAELRQQYPDHVPRPEHWGGYNVAPRSFEFWQGRPSRLHDRIHFERSGEKWQRKRLSP